jgi:hypothetical protein
LGWPLLLEEVISLARYVGDVSAQVVHIDDPPCPEIEKIDAADRIYFKTLDAALAAGYSECSTCFLRESE